MDEVNRARRRRYREENELPADAKVPVDAVTASSSGLDPHISIANAELQVPRVAEERGIPQVRCGVWWRRTPTAGSSDSSESRGVNVLELNLALDTLEKR